MKVSTGVPSPESVIERLRTAPPLRRLIGRNRTKADLLLVEVSGRSVAVKDYGPRSWLVRNLIGRWLTAREARAYRAAAGIDGVATFVGRLDRFRLATLWFDGRPLSAWNRDEVPGAALDRLDKIVATLHRRGIALGDLHHRDVLVATDGSVRVIDLATALVLGDRAGAWRRFCFRRFRDQDRVALARLRARFSGEDPDAATQALGGAATRWFRVGRRVKRGFDRLRGRRRAPRR